jgi:hypothetical protein
MTTETTRKNRKDRIMTPSTRHRLRRIFAAFLVGFMLFALLIPAAPPATAQQFTFNVPVSFSRVVEEVARGSVTCRVCNGPCGGGENRIGFGSVTINRSDFPNGSFSRTVVVRFNARPESSAANASHYFCFLAFGLQSTGNGATRDVGGNPAPNVRHLAAKPGATHVNPISGTLN